MPSLAGGLRPAAARGRGLRHAVDRVRPPGLRETAGRRRAARRRPATPPRWPPRSPRIGADDGAAGAPGRGGRERAASRTWEARGRAPARGPAEARRDERHRRRRLARSAPDLAALLASIAAHLPAAPAGHRRRLRLDATPAPAGAAAGAEVVRLDGNPGFGAANDAGVERARHDVTILLNPDSSCATPGSCGSRTLRPRARRPPRPAPAERRRERPALRSPAPGHRRARGRARPPAGPAAAPRRARRALRAASAPRRVGWAIAACVVARTALLRRLGPFDPDAFLFYEDLDLCLRAAAAAQRPSCSRPSRSSTTARARRRRPSGARPSRSRRSAAAPSSAPGWGSRALASDDAAQAADVRPPSARGPRARAEPGAPARTARGPPRRVARPPCRDTRLWAQLGADARAGLVRQLEEPEPLDGHVRRLGIGVGPVAGARPRTLLPGRLRRRLRRGGVELGHRLRRGGLLGLGLRQERGQAREVAPQDSTSPACRAPRRGGTTGRAARRAGRRAHLVAPVEARDPGGVAPQELRREVAQRADDASAGRARAGGRGTPGSARSRPAAGRGCPGAALQRVDDEHLVAGEADLAEELVEQAPGRPTKGRPCSSSWRPGASPTNMRSASAWPAPNTTLWRVAASSGQRVQPRAWRRTALSASRRSSGVRRHSHRCQTAVRRATMDPPEDATGIPDGELDRIMDTTSTRDPRTCAVVGPGRLGRGASHPPWRAPAPSAGPSPAPRPRRRRRAAAPTSSCSASRTRRSRARPPRPTRPAGSSATAPAPRARRAPAPRGLLAAPAHDRARRGAASAARAPPSRAPRRARWRPPARSPRALGLRPSARPRGPRRLPRGRLDRLELPRHARGRRRAPGRHRRRGSRAARPARARDRRELGRARPRGALTGPIARGDEDTVARQRAAVAERTPDLLALSTPSSRPRGTLGRGPTRRSRGMRTCAPSPTCAPRCRGAPRGAHDRPRADDGRAARGPPSLMRGRARPATWSSCRSSSTRRSSTMPATSPPIRATRRATPPSRRRPAPTCSSPRRREVYPPGFATTVRVDGPLTASLEGAHRGAGALRRRRDRRHEAPEHGPARRRLLRPEGRPAGRS